VRALVCIALFVLGAVVGLAAVWTHARWWGLALGAAATLVTEVAVPRGLPRVAYAAGWVVSVAYFLLARPEGDFVVASDPLGYSFLGVGLAVLVVAVATIPPRARTRATLSAGAGVSA
jgi:hypothetical protein